MIRPKAKLQIEIIGGIKINITTSKYQKENNCQPRILYVGRIPSRNEGETNIFS